MFQEQFVAPILLGLAGGMVLTVVLVAIGRVLFGSGKPHVPQVWAVCKSGSSNRDNWCVAITMQKPPVPLPCLLVGPFRSEDDAKKFCEQANG